MVVECMQSSAKVHRSLSRGHAGKNAGMAGLEARSTFGREFPKAVEAGRKELQTVTRPPHALLAAGLP
jgi:hypothetical protein